LRGDPDDCWRDRPGGPLLQIPAESDTKPLAVNASPCEQGAQGRFDPLHVVEGLEPFRLVSKRGIDPSLFTYAQFRVHMRASLQIKRKEATQSKPCLPRVAICGEHDPRLQTRQRPKWVGASNRRTPARRTRTRGRACHERGRFRRRRHSPSGLGPQVARRPGASQTSGLWTVEHRRRPVFRITDTHRECREKR